MVFVALRLDLAAGASVTTALNAVANPPTPKRLGNKVNY